ncbi:hypothetical protein [Heyndrickxia ginsengihumi]|uniref:hypothetical protein n=1 Tax=Heyndrickxia ginsengihumi TaxID=363870 RepID=UPI00352763C9
MTGIKDAVKAIPVNETPLNSDIIQPLMQSIDLIFTGANIAYGNTGQLRVYSLAKKLLPKLGYSKPVILISNLGHDIMSKDLNVSSSKTRISIHESKDSLTSKINKMFAPKQISNNPLIELCKFSVWPWLKEGDIEIPHRFSGVTYVSSFDDMCELYKRDEIGPKELKEFAIIQIWHCLNNYQKYFEVNPELVSWIKFDKI